MNRTQTLLSLPLLCKALDGACDGIWIFDNQLNVLYYNLTALKLSGLDKDSIEGRNWLELEKEGYFSGDAAPNAILTKSMSSSEFVNKVGRHLLCTAVPILDEVKNVHLVISNVRDVTNFFELNQELNTRKRQLRKVTQTLKTLQSLQHSEFVYASSQIKYIVETIKRVARTDVSVLLLGESGVGKSELAERIHRFSARAEEKLVVVNCGAIPHSLCEAEFFGYERGAFTGADKAKPGIFESANGGTLILDEIGELDLSIQVKLLRVIQERRVKRLGSQQEIPVNVRIVAATNQDLKDMVAQKRFRNDLYHRLNVIQLVIPPLRERPEDITCLLSFFLSKYNDKYGMAKTMSSQLVSQLEKYAWPGNSREMAHLVERMVVLSSHDEITCEYLPDDLREEKPQAASPIIPLKEASEAAEKAVLLQARKELGNTRSMARALQVCHVTVARKLKQYGIP